MGTLRFWGQRVRRGGEKKMAKEKSGANGEYPHRRKKNPYRRPCRASRRVGSRARSRHRSLDWPRARRSSAPRRSKHSRPERKDAPEKAAMGKKKRIYPAAFLAEDRGAH